MIDFSHNPLLLAPMAGVNDPVFRAICKRMGASLTYTEMISSKGLAYQNTKTKKMLSALPEDRPCVVQLFGSEPQVMSEEACTVVELMGSSVAYLDINMGCPARKVTTGGNGSALLQVPRVAADIVKAVSAAVSIPVTVKIRKVSSQPHDTLTFASNMAEAGAEALTIHGRTAEQQYKGEADRAIVEQVAAELSIPVIASGDVFCGEDIHEYLSRGASAVMIARGAQGNPWIFAGCKPSLLEIIEVAREHTVRLSEWDPRKLVWMRKHLAWYFKGTPSAVRVRKAVQTAVHLEDYLSILDDYQRSLKAHCAVGSAYSSDTFTKGDLPARGDDCGAQHAENDA